ncbi:MAG: FAD-dependent oxidoreductase [Coriobacteriia bacterium]
MSNKGMERRQFLKTAALAGAAVAGAGVLAGCGKSAASGDTEKWDAEADVVIIGGGGTGMAAAVEAAQAGAKTLVLEKGAKTGGSTAISGGVIQAAGTKYQKEFTKYQDDTPEKHALTWITEGEGLLDEDLVRDLANGMPGNIDWLTGLGLKYTSVYGHNHVPYLDATGYFADRIHVYEGGGAINGGSPQVEALEQAATKAGATVQLSTQAAHLITAEGKGVIGVETSDGKRIKAAKGVVIATAGIDRNEELAKMLNPQQYWDTQVGQQLTATTNTGDGIIMAMEIGAQLSHACGTIDFCGSTGQATDNRLPGMKMIHVNQVGKRFVCEDATYAYHYRAIFQQEKQHGGKTYMIFDADGIQASPWAGDKLSEALSKGVLATGDTVEALAAAIKVPAGNLKATLDEWNTNAAAGSDPVFSRNTQIVPIVKGPFYAYTNVPFNLGSCGGIKTNVECQVLDTAGEVIPHLFAGGLVQGGWIGPYYPGSGTAIAGTVHWGRKCGKNAAAETAWG